MRNESETEVKMKNFGTAIAGMLSLAVLVAGQFSAHDLK
jgi:hypothetical protein